MICPKAGEGGSWVSGYFGVYLRGKVSVYHNAIMGSSQYTIIDTKEMLNHQMSGTETLGDSLILSDNLDIPMDFTTAEAQYFINRPVKLSLTLMLFLCLEGEIVCKDDVREYRIQRNDVVLKMSGAFGETVSYSPDLKCVTVIMNERFYYPLFSSVNLSILHKELATHPICTLTDDLRDECVSLYRGLKGRLSAHKEDFLREEIIRGYLQALTFIVCSQYESFSKRQQGDSQPKRIPRQQELFNRFMDLLQAHHVEEHGLSFYADRLCVTPRYLSRVIHAVSGYHANEHIDLFIVTEAKQLLRTKGHTVQEVSELLNFATPSLFSRYFKKHTGYSPKEYQGL